MTKAGDFMILWNRTDPTEAHKDKRAACPGQNVALSIWFAAISRIV